MSYAIIRNAKIKMGGLVGMDKHNERKNDNYSNKDIDHKRTKDNYHLIKPQSKGYKAEFERIKESENLKGNLRLTGKKQSTVACEFLITSDSNFFNGIGQERTREFFNDSLEFVKNKVGEKNIISAVVHMDETTPHMHIVYIPVVQKKNSKGEMTKRINCSEFWKGFNSYGELQNDFFKHCQDKGYNLDRGEIGTNQKHVELTEFKHKTKLEQINTLEKQIKPLEANLSKYKALKVKTEEIDTRALKNALGITLIKTNDLQKLKDQAKTYIVNRNELVNVREDKKRLKKKLNSVKSESEKNSELRYELNHKIKEQMHLNKLYDSANDKIKKLELENELLKEQNNELKNIVDILKNKLKGAFESLTNIVKAFNLLKYDKTENGYKLDLEPKHDKLFNAIENYSLYWLRDSNQNDLAEELEKRIGISKGINQFLEPNKSRNRSNDLEI